MLWFEVSIFRKQFRLLYQHLIKMYIQLYLTPSIAVDVSCIQNKASTIGLCREVELFLTFLSGLVTGKAAVVCSRSSFIRDLFLSVCIRHPF